MNCNRKKTIRLNLRGCLKPVGFPLPFWLRLPARDKEKKYGQPPLFQRGFWASQIPLRPISGFLKLRSSWRHGFNPQRYWLSLGLAILLVSCSQGPGKSPTISDTSPPASSQLSLSFENRQTTLGQSLPISAEATIENQIFKLEVARTPKQQALGLMYREHLPNDRGMLFPFNPPRAVGFWMKNVSIHLDMIFLREGVVQAIAENVPPCNSVPCPTYGPKVPIDQVIELRGGRVTQLGLKVGERIKIRFLQPD